MYILESGRRVERLDVRLDVRRSRKRGNRGDPVGLVGSRALRVGECLGGCEGRAGATVWCVTP